MNIGQLEAFSNREDWEITLEILDEDDELIDVDELTFKLRNKSNKSTELSGSFTGGEITNPSPGVYVISFEESAVHNVCAGTYDVGIRMEVDGEKSQVFIGTVEVMDGVVD